MTESSNFTDYYEVLGVKPTSEVAEIRRAYIALAKQQHPDAGGSMEAMQQLNIAYRTLTSDSAKTAYDMLHNFHTGSTAPADYRYSDGREVHGVTDMSDDEIDAFLDDLFTEYRSGPPKSKQSIRDWFKNIVKKM